MICPRCGAEYGPGLTRCHDCGADLTGPAETAPTSPAGSAAERAAHQQGPVCVYRATVRGRLPIAESLLRSAGIPFVVVGGHIQQLGGVDGYGFAEIQVSAADAADAREMLADLDREA